MERQNIIEQTIENMELIYYDVSQIGQLVEEKMRKRGFEVLGDAAFTWETSTALGRPDSWLYKCFARTYIENGSPKQTVGFCIRLGGSQDQVKKIARLSISFPVISVSLLKMEEDVKKLWRQDIYNLLWSAGWDDSYLPFRKISNSKIIFSDVNDKELKGRIVTYFVDLLSLTSGDLIEQLVADPMGKMFRGDEEWVVKKGLNVIQIGENL